MKKLSIFYLISLLSLTVVSCSTKMEKPQNQVLETETVNSESIKITTTQFKSSGMKLGAIEKKSFFEVVRANGMIDVPPENRAMVSSYFGGTVKSIKLLPGEKVRQGQILFVLENPEYVQIQQDFLEAKGMMVYLESDYERQKNLFQDNVTSQKKFLKSESEYNVLKVKLEALKRKLRLMNINPESFSTEKIRTTIPVLSPINGYVTAVQVSRGAFLNPSQVAVTLVDTDHLHIELNVFEKDFAKLMPGLPITFRIQENRNRTFNAEVYLVNKVVDPEKRTVALHGHLSEKDTTAGLSPGMYIEAEIYSSENKGWALPVEALVEIEGEYYALVVDQSNDKEYSFVKKKVETGMKSSGYIEVINKNEFEDKSLFLIEGAFNLISD